VPCSSKRGWGRHTRVGVSAGGVTSGGRPRAAHPGKSNFRQAALLRGVPGAITSLGYVSSPSVLRKEMHEKERRFGTIWQHLRFRSRDVRLAGAGERLDVLAPCSSWRWSIVDFLSSAIGDLLWSVAGTTVAFGYSAALSWQARSWWLGFVRVSIPLPKKHEIQLYRTHPKRIPLATEYTNQNAR
jgi:hypothetical protein